MLQTRRKASQFGQRPRYFFRTLASPFCYGVEFDAIHVGAGISRENLYRRRNLILDCANMLNRREREQLLNVCFHDVAELPPLRHSSEAAFDAQRTVRGTHYEFRCNSMGPAEERLLDRGIGERYKHSRDCSCRQIGVDFKGAVYGARIMRCYMVELAIFAKRLDFP